MEAIVIPHGTTWGIHSPPNSKLSTQLLDENHDPEKQRLIEVYSGLVILKFTKTSSILRKSLRMYLNALLLQMNLNLAVGELEK